MQSSDVEVFQENPDVIEWRLHLTSSPSNVFDMLNSDAGRARFWAESAIEDDGVIHFRFPGGQLWDAKILENQPPHRFSLEYYGGSVTLFVLEDDGKGGTDLRLEDRGVACEYRTEVIAGWVSVLMALKAAVDFDVDLRNHDVTRTWQQGYVEN